MQLLRIQLSFVIQCPHDHPCPLQHSGPSGLVCGFSQRLQRPTFVRRTKHAKQGHEDIGYSYVVIRRGPRPDSTSLGAEGRPAGRVGGVEREAIERTKGRTGVLRELQRAHEDGHDRNNVDPQSPLFSVPTEGSASAPTRSSPSADVNSVPSDQSKAQIHVPVDDGVGIGAVETLGPVASADAASISPRVDVHSSDETTVLAQERVPLLPMSTSAPSAPAQVLISAAESPLWTGYSGTEPRPKSPLEDLEPPLNLEEVLRSEAYGWPRLVFPPLKKSGHVIIDACTREGSYPSHTPATPHLSNPITCRKRNRWTNVHFILFYFQRKNYAVHNSKIAGQTTVLRCP